MISIKVECGCGQRYAFDVEPVDGRMPYTVACPVCATDGTSVANEVIAQNVHAQVAASPGGRIQLQETAADPAVQIATPSPPKAAPRRSSVLMPGQTDPNQVAHEARAKIFWGDPPLEVTKFLMINNIPRAEAMEIVRELSHERAVQMRKNGIGKIVSGTLMVCVPVGGWFMGVAALSIKLFAIMIMLGLWGAWRVLKGTFMLVAPRAQFGDVSEQ